MQRIVFDSGAVFDEGEFSFASRRNVRTAIDRGVPLTDFGETTEEWDLEVNAPIDGVHVGEEIWCAVFISDGCVPRTLQVCCIGYEFEPFNHKYTLRVVRDIAVENADRLRQKDCEIERLRTECDRWVAAAIEHGGAWWCPECEEMQTGKRGDRIVCELCELDAGMEMNDA